MNQVTRPVSAEIIPVVLFAYARPAHMLKTLECLRENRVPFILAFADGAKGQWDATAVAETRAILRRVNWCDVRVVERVENMGLGRNVLAGVTEVAQRYDAFVVWEDDLTCVPGTYEWLCVALRYYRDDPRVMSVTGWTHPRVTPVDVGSTPWFDGRAECWVWGAWARSWEGMANETAVEKMLAAEQIGIARDSYGSDLPDMAKAEFRQNIWAVRWLYHHLQHGGLCLRPPWSMVEHIGSDAQATNCSDSGWMRQREMRAAPSVPTRWPEVRLQTGCSTLWQRVTRRSWRQRAKAWLRPVFRN